ncbi:MAG: hypothetical protein P1P82_16565 [Bacteroidales bacterium]|nr:hypothetical protein [Bacteroidales bacterium]
MEYSFRSHDPRDVRGDDINFYLTGKALDNSVEQNRSFSISQSMLFNGVRDGVIYRQAIMRKPPNNGVGYIIDLAEITIPGGVIRVDRSRLAFEYELTLGHFGLPHLDGEKPKIAHIEDGRRKGTLVSIPGRKVALVAYHGWDRVGNLEHEGRNAEAARSTVAYVQKKRLAKNPPMELMITAMLHKTGDADWTDEELNPVRDMNILDVMPSGSALGVEITLFDGRVVVVDFRDIDGKRGC